jgi:gluconolactonase
MQPSPLTAEVPLEEIKVFAEGLDHPECVCWHPDGCLFAGGEAGQIYRISGDGKLVEEIARTGGFLLGLAISPDGKWLAACDLVKKCLWKLELSTGSLTVLSQGSHNAAFQIPNHLVFDRSGSLLVSDSGSPGEINGRILRVAQTGATTVWHNGPFHFANGLALAPSGDALFVVCTFAGSVERVGIGPEGAPGERSTYLTLDRVLPDGVAFDPAGDLYLTCYTPSRIYRVRHGEPPQVSLFADDWTDHQLCHPTNVCFGGANGSTLFAANLGRWHIASIDARHQR